MPYPSGAAACRPVPPPGAKTLKEEHLDLGTWVEEGAFQCLLGATDSGRRRIATSSVWQ